MDKKLEVKNLQISFRTQGGILKAVRNISFDLYEGETLAIVGESGSGKSVTSRAIMGILAGNSIVEGGEILYDGQDLLKISEEDFHKLRGDKVAMVFQNPLSSLNPIMRIGQQMTEAMLLKAKTGRRNAKTNFNNMLKTLGANINLADQNDGDGIDESAQIAEKIKKFDTFCISATKIEREFNKAYGSAIELEMNVEELILFIGKGKKVDLVAQLKRIKKEFLQCANPYVIVNDDKFATANQNIGALIAKGKELTNDEVAPVLQDVLAMVKDALAKDRPNFFTMGYYLMVNPEADLSSMPVSEMNAMTRKFLDDDFMIDFIATASKGVTYSHAKAIENKKAALANLDTALAYFKAGNLDKATSYGYVKSLKQKTVAAIDRLAVKKASVEYVFPTALEDAIDAYFAGVKNNPIEEKKYLKNKAKYDQIIAKGQNPEWVLTPQVIVDLDLQCSNICKIIENLQNFYISEIASAAGFDATEHVVEIIDYLKDQASRFVVEMNKSIAKAKAIKLLEEVGIPEPAARYNQYPFELSGGMRQRVVIAIALAADPDILICDEPTTALDVTIQAQILELINSIKEQRKLSVIFITHNMGVVANMADRIAVMYAGKIVEYGKSEEIFYEPAHPYTWALLSSMPDLHTSGKMDSIPGTPPDLHYPPKGDAFAPRNKYALEIDFEIEPPLFEITPSHSAATWLLHPNAPKAEMPQIIKDRIERMKKERENDV
jgi:oligopeptide/dipeptide ABC transporter ATP-binding protein